MNQATAQIEDLDPLFASAHAALTFAYNFSPEQYAPAILGRLIGPAIGRGKGLVGMDGAAQAGMILREVDGLGQLAAHFLAARFSPNTVPCACRSPCCAGYRHCPAWDHAVSWIAEQAITQLTGHLSNYRLRRGLVMRFFGEHVNMSELSVYCGVNRDTASQHNARLVPWLKHNEGTAMHGAIYALKSAGIAQ